MRGYTPGRGTNLWRTNDKCGTILPTKPFSVSHLFIVINNVINDDILFFLFRQNAFGLNLSLYPHFGFISDGEFTFRDNGETHRASIRN